MRWGIIIALFLWCGVGLAEDSVEDLKSKFEQAINDAKNKISVLEDFAEQQKSKVTSLSNSLTELKKENAELKSCRIYLARETITRDFDKDGKKLFGRQSKGDWGGAVVPAKESLTWKLEIPEDASYALDVFYATDGDRPCRVQVEDHHFFWSGAHTGGFSLKDFQYKTFSHLDLKQGVRKLIITPEVVGPHYLHFIVRKEEL